MATAKFRMADITQEVGGKRGGCSQQVTANLKVTGSFQSALQRRVCAASCSQQLVQTDGGQQPRWAWPRWAGSRFAPEAARPCQGKKSCILYLSGNFPVLNLAT